MKSLENKIPPLIIVVFFLVLIFLLKNLLEVFTFSYQIYTSLFFLCLSISFFLTGIIEFRKHKTTLNPLMPEESTTLVTTGVFKLSRNPIYLSLLNLLIAFSIYLGSFPIDRRCTITFHLNINIKLKLDFFLTIN